MSGRVIGAVHTELGTVVNDIDIKFETTDHYEVFVVISNEDIWKEVRKGVRKLVDTRI
jgi:hypothetical protein